jgi:hypothetical protein
MIATAAPHNCDSMVTRRRYKISGPLICNDLPTDQRDQSRAAAGNRDSPSRIDAVESKAGRTRNAQTVEVLVSRRAY